MHPDPTELQRLADDGNPHADIPPTAPADARPGAPDLGEYDAETVRLVMDAERAVGVAEAEWEDLKRAASDAKKLMETRVSALRALIRDREEQRGKPPEPTLLDMLKDATAPKWHGWAAKSLDLSEEIKAKLAPFRDLTAGELLREVTGFDPAEGTPFGLTIAECADVRMLLAKIGDTEPATVPEDLWKAYPIDRWARFGLAPKDIEKMAAGEIKKETGRSPITTVGDLSNFTAPSASGWTRKLADIKGVGPGGADRISDAETRFWAWWNDGGQEEFARERGLIRGDATTAGVGSEGSRGGGSGEEDADPDATDLYEEASLTDDIRTNGI